MVTRSPESADWARAGPATIHTACMTAATGMQRLAGVRSTHIVPLDEPLAHRVLIGAGNVAFSLDRSKEPSTGDARTRHRHRDAPGDDTLYRARGRRHTRARDLPSGWMAARRRRIARTVMS